MTKKSEGKTRENVIIFRLKSVNTVVFLEVTLDDETIQESTRGAAKPPLDPSFCVSATQ